MTGLPLVHQNKTTLSPKSKHVVPETIVHKALAMYSAGVDIPAIAGALEVGVQSVNRWIRIPEHRELIAQMRAAMRVSVVSRLEDQINDLADRLKAAVPSAPARDVDALSRALLNLEKAAASASGELSPARQQPPKVSVEVILAPWAAGASSGKIPPIPIGGEVGEGEDSFGTEASDDFSSSDKAESPT